VRDWKPRFTRARSPKPLLLKRAGCLAVALRLHLDCLGNARGQRGLGLLPSFDEMREPGEWLMWGELASTPGESVEWRT
jgi:hypothetical protein